MSSSSNNNANMALGIVIHHRGGRPGGGGDTDNGGVAGAGAGSGLANNYGTSGSSSSNDGWMQVLTAYWIDTVVCEGGRAGYYLPLLLAAGSALFCFLWLWRTLRLYCNGRVVQ